MSYRLLLPPMLAAASVALAQPPANPESIVWVPFERMRQELGLPHVDHREDGLVFSNATHVLRFYAGRRSAVLDGVCVWLHQPPRDAATNDLRDLAQPDYDGLLHPVLLATAAPPPRLRIVLDPGHGGDDTGARTAGTPETLEKTITLDITRLVAEQLSAAGQHVRMTRTGDVTAPLSDRSRLAAEQQAQLFVSIHANSAPANHQAIGAETYILAAAGYPGTGEGSSGMTNPCAGNRFDTANGLLGFAIQRRCAAQSAMDRGLKRARYYVLREAPCPAALVECGFLTNTNEAARLADSAYRRQMADAIAAGILDYGRLATPLPEAPSPAPASLVAHRTAAR